MKSINHIRGLSLVELLIALALGALLSLGVVNVFIGNSRTAAVERALSQVQQSGRAAIELINKDIRRAGYIGCTSIGGSVDVLADGITAQRLLAYSATAAGLSPDPTGDVAAVVNGVARRGTDVLVLDYADYLGDDLIAAADSFQALDSTIQLDDQEAPDESRECELATGDLVLLSNCLTTHLFEVSSASDSTSSCASNTLTINAGDNGQIVPAPTFQYGEGSDVARYLQFIWYVADTGRVVNGVPVYALFRLASNQAIGAAEEMVEGVEFMRVEVGLRNGGGMRYVTPGTPGIDWDTVESLRIALLVRSFDAVTRTDDGTTYQLLNTTVPATGTVSHAGGRYVRRVYTSSQVIRNTDYGN